MSIPAQRRTRLPTATPGPTHMTIGCVWLMSGRLCGGVDSTESWPLPRLDGCWMSAQASVHSWPLRERTDGRWRGPRFRPQRLPMPIARYGLTIHVGVLEAAAPPGPYDIVSLWHVIEHVPDPPATLRFCHRLLAEHGRIILAMPNDGRIGVGADSGDQRRPPFPSKTTFVALRAPSSGCGIAYPTLRSEVHRAASDSMRISCE